MITKSELLGIPQLAREVEAEANRIEVMRAHLTSPKGFDSRERVQSSGTQQSALVDVIIDLEQQLDEKRATLNVLKRQARALIIKAELEGEDNALMSMRYVEAYSWELIEELMHYSRATVFRRNNEIIHRIYGDGETAEIMRPDETR